MPRLAQNEAGDAWTSIVEGRTNQFLRVMGGLNLPLPLGSLDLGLGWKLGWSGISGGATTVLSQGIAFELMLRAGK